MFSDFMDFYGSSGGGSTGKRDLGNIITERAEVMRNLTRMASACEVVAGKWLLYIPHDQAEEAWRKIVTATVKNELGSEAIMRRSALKDKLDMEGELIKVYTHDYRDKLAAARVLEKLKTLGVLNPEKEYYYKSGSFRSGMTSTLTPTLLFLCIAMTAGKLTGSLVRRFIASESFCP